VRDTGEIQLVKALVGRIELNGTRGSVDDKYSASIPAIVRDAVTSSNLLEGENIRDAIFIVEDLDITKITLKIGDSRAGIAKNSDRAVGGTNISEANWLMVL